MSVTESGISSLGVTVGYATGGSSTVPAAFTQLERCNAIGGIELSTEKIDSSALEDSVSRYVAGRADTGGDWSLTFNLTNETYTQLNTMIQTYISNVKGKSDTVMWFEVYSPSMTQAFFVIAQPPEEIPLPEMSQNELMTVEITLAIDEYKGMKTAVVPKSSTTSTT